MKDSIRSPRNKQVNRRRFLRMAATTAAAVMTVSVLPDQGSPEEENPVPAGLARYVAEQQPLASFDLGNGLRATLTTDGHLSMPVRTNGKLVTLHFVDQRSLVEGQAA